MPFITSGDAEVFETHGVRFRSYVRPSRGSAQLCAWRIDVPAGLEGTPHRPSREEIICCIDGELTITVDDATQRLHPGDVVYVPAGSEIRLDGGPEGGAAWTTTLAGLEATLSDGSVLRPPWTM
ncbi:MAG TPA: cupin domain-containing protein [Streptosporangiaceae bacterium]|nr:cupin domain-containing protein [Streptosporangiaceae bacterium]